MAGIRSNSTYQTSQEEHMAQTILRPLEYRSMQIVGSGEFTFRIASTQKMSCLQSLSCTYLYKTKSNNQIDCTILVQTLSFCTSHSRLWIQIPWQLCCMDIMSASIYPQASTDKIMFNLGITLIDAAIPKGTIWKTLLDIVSSKNIFTTGLQYLYKVTGSEYTSSGTNLNLSKPRHYNITHSYMGFKMHP